jgi:vacuolar-type H+-ATPase subunit C/Vma6
MGVIRAIRYAYINAKVRAMHSRLLGREGVLSLVEQPNLAAIAGVLEGTEYAGAFDEELNLQRFERRLKEKIVESAQKVEQSMPSVGIAFFSGFVKRYELESIKTFFRAHALLDRKRILEMIPEQHHHLFRGMEGPEDLATGLGVVEEYEEFRRTGNLLSLEASLDEQYYTALFAHAGDEPELLELLGREVDIKNLKIASRLAAARIRQSISLLPGGYELSPWMLEEIIAGGSLERAASLLEGTAYHKVFVESLAEYREKHSLLTLEIALERLLYDFASSVVTQVPFGIAPLVAHFYIRELEAADIVAIAKLKAEGFEAEEIRRMLRSG